MHFSQSRGCFLEFPKSVVNELIMKHLVRLQLERSNFVNFCSCSTVELFSQVSFTTQPVTSVTQLTVWVYLSAEFTRNWEKPVIASGCRPLRHVSGLKPLGQCQVAASETALFRNQSAPRSQTEVCVLQYPGVHPDQGELQSNTVSCASWSWKVWLLTHPSLMLEVMTMSW